MRPYAVHATYTFDGSTAAAKRMRFAEVGLWSPNADRLRCVLYTGPHTTAFAW